MKNGSNTKAYYNSTQIDVASFIHVVLYIYIYIYDRILTYNMCFIIIVLY